ncbi:MAG: hypothetical protein P8188_12780 [Gemmatimonadota bacterium]
MRRFLMLLLVSVVGVACGDEGPLQPDRADGSALHPTAPANASAATATMLPFKGQGVFSTSVDPGACPEFPGAIGVLIDFSGVALHLGRIEGTAINCVVIGADGSRALQAQTATMAAANGDVLFLRGTATADGTAVVYAPDGSFSLGPVPLVGGTGRFTGATGYYTLTGSDPVQGPFGFTGQISSVGSSR